MFAQPEGSMGCSSSFTVWVGTKDREPHQLAVDAGLPRQHVGKGVSECCHHPGNGPGLQHVCLLTVMVFLAPE